MDATSPKHRVVVIGAGFGGVEVVRGLAGAGADIIFIDRRNHHLFQPLLYQVATASLSPSEIAWPIRSIFKGRRDVRTMLARVDNIEPAEKRVILEGGEAVPFDTLVLATGARHSYFDHPEWEAHAPGLKTFDDALEIRRRILLAFERAELEHDPERRAGLLTFVVVGGGPTGVELAGTIVELAHDTLAADFRAADTREARVILVEAGPRLLPSYLPALSDYARQALERLGVEIRLGAAVDHIDEGRVVFGDHDVAAGTIIWAAGVRASGAAWLDVDSDKAGRVLVQGDLSVPGDPDIFVIGDAAHMTRPDGSLVPGIAPAAKQAGQYVARVIRSRLCGAKVPPPFAYHHQGDLAQIGKRRAITDFGWIRFRGAIAWWIWGIAHIYFLIGVRTRLAVALDWLWISLRNQRSARLISDPGSVSQEG